MDGAEGPLAEFAALRAEIDRRSTSQLNVLLFQLTSAGAVLSFSLASPGPRSFFLLTLPITSFLLGTRYVTIGAGIELIGDYIRINLSPRVPGGLQWQKWILEQPSIMGRIRFFHPILVAFPAISAAVLVWALPQILTTRLGIDSFGRVGLMLIWCIDLAATVALSVMCRPTIRRYSPLGRADRLNRQYKEG
jgi:hypothetical protein